MLMMRGINQMNSIHIGLIMPWANLIYAILVILVHDTLYGEISDLTYVL